MAKGPENLTASAFKDPAILLSGPVDYNMYTTFRQQLAQAPPEGLIVIELSTLGGDPEVARMMGEDVRFHHEINPDRRFIFLGKAAIYSAGTTFMSFFARANRYLTPGTRLMVHERKLSKSIILEGPLTSCVPIVEAALNELKTSIVIQNEGFDNLISGSQVARDELLRRASSDWFIDAEEAVRLGLIQAVI